MKKLSLLIPAVAGLLLMASTAPSLAAEKPKGKEVTIAGDAKCAMCMLKESDQCQTVVQAKDKKGKVVTYYLADNEVTKAFHQNICKEAKQVTVTGTVKKVHGKEQLTPTKIQLASK
jgi:hypothetical protein